MSGLVVQRPIHAFACLIQACLAYPIQVQGVVDPGCKPLKAVSILPGVLVCQGIQHILHNAVAIDMQSL